MRAAAAGEVEAAVAEEAAEDNGDPALVGGLAETAAEPTVDLAGDPSHPEPEVRGYVGQDHLDHPGQLRARRGAQILVVDRRHRPEIAGGEGGGGPERLQVARYGLELGGVAAALVTVKRLLLGVVGLPLFEQLHLRFQMGHHFANGSVSHGAQLPKFASGQRRFASSYRKRAC